MPTVVPLLRSLLLVLAAALAVAPLAPPAHVHELTAEDGQRESLTHRHAAPHHHHEGHPGHDRATFNDDASVVATLDAVFLIQSTYADRSPGAAVAAPEHEPILETRTIRSKWVERLIHGPPPPRTASRAPPSTHFL
jgi:hypothetical protein